MARPRTADGFRPNLPDRRKIAYAYARRWHRMFCEMFPDDARQIAWLISLTPRKHFTPAEFRRFAGRVWTEQLKLYGFRREYRTGNRKTGLFHDTDYLETRNESER